MFGRPIPIWLILAFLAYGVLGTIMNLGAAFNGGTPYTPFQLIVGSIGVVLMIWLAAEIWTKGRRILMAACTNLGFIVVSYSLMVIGYASAGQQDMLVASLIVGAIMAAVWGGVTYYLWRYAKAVA